MTLRLDDDMHEALRREAFERRIPINEIIRNAIELRRTLRLSLREQARAALGFVDQTLYANRDNSEAVVWRNDEVIELLEMIRSAIVAGPESPISSTEERQ